MTIKAIIFDLAGVVINIQQQQTKDAFIKLGATKESVAKVFGDDTQIDDYDAGKITSAELRAKLKKELSIEEVTDEEFDNAWSAELIAISQDDLADTLTFIKRFKDEGYKIFLLSNMNEIEHIAINKKILEKHECSTLFHECFIKEYYSYITRIIKPSPESFQQILNSYNLKPEEALFIDDSKSNVEGAEKIGLNAYHLPRNKLKNFDLQKYLNGLNNKLSIEHNDAKVSIQFKIG